MGRLLSETDISGNTLQYRYDNWGRLVEKEFADGNIETYTFSWSYNASTSGSDVYRMEVSSPGSPTVTTYYDALAREVRS